VNICELTVKNYRKYRLTDYLRYLVRAAPTLVSSHGLSTNRQTAPLGIVFLAASSHVSQLPILDNLSNKEYNKHRN
jgi:hypothetical protein